MKGTVKVITNSGDCNTMNGKGGGTPEDVTV